MDEGASGVVSGQLEGDPPFFAMGDLMCCVLPSMIVETKPPRQPLTHVCAYFCNPESPEGSPPACSSRNAWRFSPRLCDFVLSL
jgi:hypothetical protein